LNWPGQIKIIVRKDGTITMIIQPYDETHVNALYTHKKLSIEDIIEYKK
jgi:hypothetical protein